MQKARSKIASKSERTPKLRRVGLSSTESILQGKAEDASTMIIAAWATGGTAYVLPGIIGPKSAAPAPM
jgi:hypothetical protein